MNRDEHRHSDSTTAVIVAVVALLFVGGLVVLGAATFLFVRVRTVTRVEHERAMIARQEANLARAQIQIERQAVAEEAMADLPANVAQDDAGAPRSERAITIALDPNGLISIGNEPVEFDELKMRLQQTVESGNPPPVTIHVDDQCPFKHLAPILSVCNELGISDRQFSSVPPAGLD